MECAACQGQMVKRQGEIELRINGKLFLVENAPHQKCLSCGERILSPDVSQEIFDKITKKEYKEKQLVVPVVESSAAQAV
jgi:YgiT-type zinc finger domain-containing protein